MRRARFRRMEISELADTRSSSRTTIGMSADTAGDWNWTITACPAATK